MADKVKLSDLRTAIRAREEVRTEYVSNGDLDLWINAAIKDLYDHILAVEETYTVKVSDTINVVSGIDRYPLPEDFTHLLRVEVLYDSSNDWRPLKRFNLSERSNHNWYTPTKLFYRYRVMDDAIFLSPIPSESASMRLWYMPTLKKLVLDEDTADFIYGWEEYVILRCMEYHRNKEDTDASEISNLRMECLDRILARAKERDLSEPDTIRDEEAEYYYAKYPWIRSP